MHGFPRRDEPDQLGSPVVHPLDKNDDEQAEVPRVTDQSHSYFTRGRIDSIGKRAGEAIVEDARSVAEVDTMLLDIPFALCRVPIEARWRSRAGHESSQETGASTSLNTTCCT